MSILNASSHSPEDKTPSITGTEALGTVISKVNSESLVLPVA